jgi:hypothetical protein
LLSSRSATLGLVAYLSVSYALAQIFSTSKSAGEHTALVALSRSLRSLSVKMDFQLGAGR